MKPSLTIRPAQLPDYRITEELTRDAFWDVYKPGCDEHLVLHWLRKSTCYIPALDLVAFAGEALIGHIICTRASVVNSKAKSFAVLCAGPFSIHPEFQKKGLGSELMKYCIQQARNLEYTAIILFGNPDYYHRFGFRNAAEFGIKTRDGMNFEPFMALELKEGGLQDTEGHFFENEAFLVSVEELATFEQHFPFREKHVTNTQLTF